MTMVKDETRVIEEITGSLPPRNTLNDYVILGKQEEFKYPH